MLAAEECEPCEGVREKLKGEEINALLGEAQEWDVIKFNQIDALTKTFSFDNFVDALAYTNRVGKMAEGVNHHPDITIRWGSVSIVWYTHAINGLHRNDFRCAARCDGLYSLIS